MRAAARLAAALGLVAALAAASRADVDVDVRFGHGGAHVAGAATPMDVLLRNSSAKAVTVDVTVNAPSGFAGEGLAHRRRVTLGPNAARVECFLVAGPAGWVTEGSVRVETTPRVPVRSPAKVGDRGVLEIGADRFLPQGANAIRPADARAIGVVGDARSVLEARIGATRGDEETWKGTAPPRFVEVSPDAVRLAPLALEGLESLVVVDPDASFCDDPATAEALLDWVALGGRLVVSLGEHAASFASSPVAEAMPARWSGSDRTDYGAAARALGCAGSSEGAAPGPRARLTSAEPDAVVRTPGLWIERRFGTGSVALLTVDVTALVERARLTPRGTRDLADRVAPPRIAPPGWKGGQPWERVEFDVGSRVGRALRQDAFRPPPLLAVLLGLVLYVLVVGPVDWFVLRRLKKERLTTFTFAASVAAFTVLAYGVSFLIFSSDAVVNRVTFVRYADGGRPGRELVSVHDLMGVYAPTGGTHELAFGLPAAVLGSDLPGTDGSGGVGAALPVVLSGTDPLRATAAVEVAFRSQRLVHSSACGPVGRTLSVTGSAGGDVVVRNELPVDLLECWVFVPQDRVAVVGAVAAGSEGRATTWSPAQFATWNLSAHFSGGFFGRAADDEKPEDFRRFLAGLVAAPMTSSESSPSGWEALRAAGIVRDRPAAGRALVVGVASELPIPLPEGSAAGRRHVVLVKEVDLP